MHVVYDSCFFWRYESSLRFGIGGPRGLPRVTATMTSKHFVNFVKVARILFKLIIYPSFERALKYGRMKSKIFSKSSLHFSFGQDSFLISESPWINSVKAVLLQIFLRFGIVIFSKNFAFCLTDFLKLLMISFCSMPWVADWFPLRKIIKRTNVFYPVCLKK